VDRSKEGAINVLCGFVKGTITQRTTTPATDMNLAENVARQMLLLSKIPPGTNKTQYTLDDILAGNLYLLSKNILC